MSNKSTGFSESSQLRNTVFIGYSHKDLIWVNRLKIHLKPLEEEYNIQIWDDRKIHVGTKWREEINKALDSTRVAILFISADFFASDFIMKNELPPLLTHVNDSGVIILPIISGPSWYYDVNPLSEYGSINDPNEPLLAMDENSREKIFSKTVMEIRNLFKN